MRFLEPFKKLLPVPARPAPRNLLLRALPASALKLLAGEFEEVTLSRGEVLFEPGAEVAQITFPCDGTVAMLLVTMQDGSAIETAMIGHEGAIGGVVSQGYLPAFNRAVVQIGGPALRLNAKHLQAAKQASPAMRNLFTRYADCLLAQVLQSVACNALHPIDQRCAKWLLTLHDRVGDETVPVTQEALADMLGVRRTYLSRVLGGLQEQGLISIGRGRISINDRAALEAAACECHGRVRDHFAEVLGATYVADGTLVALTPPVSSRSREQAA